MVFGVHLLDTPLLLWTLLLANKNIDIINFVYYPFQDTTAITNSTMHQPNPNCKYT